MLEQEFVYGMVKKSIFSKMLLIYLEINFTFLLFQLMTNLAEFRITREMGLWEYL